MVTVNIEGTPRTLTGKTASKSSRKEGNIPCVLYSKNGNVQFFTTFNEIRDLVYTPEFKLANITVEGTSYTCILKEIQLNPLTDMPQHIDFLQLMDGRSIKVEVPVKFDGISPGVRAGGKFTAKIRKVKIKTKPENLVSEVVASIAGLRLGQSLRIRDIVPIEGIEILNPPALPIAAVTVPRGLKAGAVEEEEAPAETAEA